MIVRPRTKSLGKRLHQLLESFDAAQVFFKKLFVYNPGAWLLKNLVLLDCWEILNNYGFKAFMVRVNCVLDRQDCWLFSNVLGQSWNCCRDR
jgi:hypothetical protein